jgi:hypothetical protein
MITPHLTHNKCPTTIQWHSRHEVQGLEANITMMTIGVIVPVSWPNVGLMIHKSWVGAFQLNGQTIKVKCNEYRHNVWYAIKCYDPKLRVCSLHLCEGNGAN